jgi:hypothetical protein
MIPAWQGVPLRALIARPGLSLRLLGSWRQVHRFQADVELARRHFGPDSQEEADALDGLEAALDRHETLRASLGVRKVTPLKRR